MAVLAVSDDLHRLVAKKKIEISEKYGKNIDMKDITNAAIKKGMETIDEELGLTNKEKIT